MVPSHPVNQKTEGKNEDEKRDRIGGKGKAYGRVRGVKEFGKERDARGDDAVAHHVGEDDQAADEEDVEAVHILIKRLAAALQISLCGFFAPGLYICEGFVNLITRQLFFHIIETTKSPLKIIFCFIGAPNFYSDR